MRPIHYPLLFAFLTLSSTTLAQNPSPSSQGFTQLAAGDYHTLALRADGTLWACGLNEAGSLGDGTTQMRPALVPVRTPAAAAPGTRWTRIWTGHFRGFAQRSDGTLWAWGRNTNGELGDGTQQDQYVPVLVLPPPGAAPGTQWTDVAVGITHTLAVRSDGTLWGWGRSGSGQLGLYPVTGGKNEITAPAGAGAGTRWVQVSAGNTFSVGLRSDGRLYSWGVKEFLGQQAPIIGTYNAVPTTVATPVAAAPGTRWIRVVAGPVTTLALRSDSTMWGWGANYSSQLGDGTQTARPLPVVVARPAAAPARARWRDMAINADHAIGLLSDGSIWGWGDNQAGNLGLNNQLFAQTPTREFTRGQQWTAVAVGMYHSVALQAGGDLFGTGARSVPGGGAVSYGQLGDNTTAGSLVFRRSTAQPLGVNGASRSIGQVVYPNPVHERLYLPEAWRGEPVYLLEAVTGRQVRAIRAGEKEMDMTQLPPGMYLLRQGQQALRVVVE
jgi:alpha-tubulin suppressor-like RCC1 family protein